MYYLTFEIYNFILDRPQKVSLSQVEEAQVEFPKITVCSPAFFNKTKYDNEIYHTVNHLRSFLSSCHQVIFNVALDERTTIQN